MIFPTLNGFIINETWAWGFLLVFPYCTRPVFSSNKTAGCGALSLNTLCNKFSLSCFFIRDYIRTGELLKFPVNDLERCRNAVFSMNFPKRRTRSSIWMIVEGSQIALWELLHWGLTLTFAFNDLLVVNLASLFWKKANSWNKKMRN